MLVNIIFIYVVWGIIKHCTTNLFGEEKCVEDKIANFLLKDISKK